MTQAKSPSLLDAVIPVVALVLLLALAVYLFGADASSGPAQIVLILGAAIAAILAVKNGHRWADLQAAMVDGISTAMGAILILLSVGALIGTWLMSGTVPTLIYLRAPAPRSAVLFRRNLPRAEKPVPDPGRFRNADLAAGPWNTCGAYMAATLGVATFAYLPFAFLNLINPLVSILYGITGFTITRVEPEPEPIPAPA